MVLALPRSVPRCLGSLASRRLFHQAAAASRPVFHGRRPIPTSTAPPYRGVPSGRLRGGLPGPGTSIRMLTGAREKVKVLLVLYDGGQHAKDVSSALLASLVPPRTPLGEALDAVGRLADFPASNRPGDISEGWSPVRGSSAAQETREQPCVMAGGRDLLPRTGTADAAREEDAEEGGGPADQPPLTVCRSPNCSARPRTSSASVSGSRTRATPS